MFFAELLKRSLDVGNFTLTQRKPLPTYAKRYMECLDADPATCPPAVYYLSPDEMAHRLDRHFGNPKISPSYSVSYRHNIRKGMMALFEVGVRQGWLLPRELPIQSWRAVPNRIQVLKMLPRPFAGRDRTPYGLGRGPMGRVKKGTIAPPATPLADLAPILHEQLTAYLDSCTPIHRQGRSKRIYKKSNTQTVVRDAVIRLAGYAVREQHLPADRLDLLTLCQPELLQAYAWWLIGRFGKRTAEVSRIFMQMTTIARHYLKDEKLTAAIVALYGNEDLPDEEPVKTEVWLDLKDLNDIANSVYPLNEQRLRENWRTEQVANHLADPAYPLPRGMNLKLTAVWVEQALILALWAHRPLRQRNIREMKLGVNLLANADGTYQMHFEGAGLKTARRRHKRRQMKVNTWDAHFPNRLLPRLREWLTIWRPKLLPASGSPYVFLNQYGGPYSEESLRQFIKYNIAAFTANRPAGPLYVTPHVLRGLWMTQMMLAGVDLGTVTKLMGDSIQVVYEHYLMLDKSKPLSEWTRQLGQDVQRGID